MVYVEFHDGSLAAFNAGQLAWNIVAGDGVGHGRAHLGQLCKVFIAGNAGLWLDFIASGKANFAALGGEVLRPGVHAMHACFVEKIGPKIVEHGVDFGDGIGNRCTRGKGGNGVVVAFFSA